MLICTDSTLSEDEIIQFYGKRWDIEVFFKTSKSVLRLTGECRSLSYDAMCAQCAIVFARYMFLAVGVREEQDIRTAGPLFYPAADELADISVAESMEKLQLFLTKLLGVFHASKQDICALTTDFIRGLPKYIASFLELPASKGDFAPKNC